MPIKINTMRILFLTLLITSLFSACLKDDVETGISGYIEYGESDCLPSDELNVEFDAYSGELFFIVKEALDSLQIESFDDIIQLRNNSISVQIKQGELFTKLPAGDYYVWAENIYEGSERYTLSIKHGEILNKDIKFIRCLH